MSFLSVYIRVVSFSCYSVFLVDDYCTEALCKLARCEFARNSLTKILQTRQGPKMNNRPYFRTLEEDSSVFVMNGIQQQHNHNFFHYMFRITLFIIK